MSEFDLSKPELKLSNGQTVPQTSQQLGVTSWEQQAVDEIINAEKRIATIHHYLRDAEETWKFNEIHGLGLAHIEQEIEELYSELSDLQEIVGETHE